MRAGLGRRGGGGQGGRTGNSRVHCRQTLQCTVLFLAVLDNYIIMTSYTMTSQVGLPEVRHLKVQSSNGSS